PARRPAPKKAAAPRTNKRAATKKAGTKATAEPAEAGVGPEPAEPKPAPKRASKASGASAAMQLSSASFDDLRGLGMSVTQAKRVINYREKIGGFSSVDDLDEVPGFPKGFLADMKEKVRV